MSWCHDVLTYICLSPRQELILEDGQDEKAFHQNGSRKTCWHKDKQIRSCHDLKRQGAASHVMTWTSYLCGCGGNLIAEDQWVRHELVRKKGHDPACKNPTRVHMRVGGKHGCCGGQQVAVQVREANALLLFLSQEPECKRWVIALQHPLHPLKPIVYVLGADQSQTHFCAKPDGIVLANFNKGPKFRPSGNDKAAANWCTPRDVVLKEGDVNTTPIIITGPSPPPPSSPPHQFQNTSLCLVVYPPVSLSLSLSPCTDLHLRSIFFVEPEPQVEDSDSDSDSDSDQEEEELDQGQVPDESDDPDDSGDDDDEEPSLGETAAGQEIAHEFGDDGIFIGAIFTKCDDDLCQATYDDGDQNDLDEEEHHHAWELARSMERKTAPQKKVAKKKKEKPAPPQKKKRKVKKQKQKTPPNEKKPAPPKTTQHTTFPLYKVGDTCSFKLTDEPCKGNHCLLSLAMLTGSGHLRNKRPLVVSGHF
jgi:hypothetical protein